LSEKTAVAKIDLPWPLPLRIAFRFFFSLVSILCVPGLITMSPGGGALEQNALGDRWNLFVSWVGAHVFHLAQLITADPNNGSGDRLFNWVELACYCAISLIACAVWSAFDRKRADYRKLNGWLLIGVRYYLIGMMMFYGFSKVIKNQFPDPGGASLLQRAGDFSPMGLAWFFMGSSAAYTFFAGFGEVLGAALLFFRRTATLGALVIAGVMTNVVALNFCYDIPVKIGSSTLLALAVYLVTPDLTRIAKVLLFNQPAGARDLSPPYRARGLILGGYLLKAAMAYSLIWCAAKVNLDQHDALTAKHPIDGLWKVASFLREGIEIAPSIEDPSRFTYVILVSGKYASSRALDESKTYFSVNEGAPGQWILRPRGQGSLSSEALTLSQEPLAPDRAVLTGEVRGKQIELKLDHVREDSFLLVNRGFHWVNDDPFNR
jgi:hypothetical protein